MTCEYNYCIYNKKLTCILDEIQVDSSGMCDSCETVAIPQESLEKYKEKRLKEIEEIWEKLQTTHLEN